MSDLLAAPHPSPLDEKIMDGVQAANPFGRSWLTGEELAEEFHLLPDCQRKCTKTLHDSLLGTFKRATYVVKYHKICRSYKEAKSCVDEEKVRCSESSDMFEMLTSGIEYMCVEQGKAFNATIKCIDRNSHAVKALCEEECFYPNHLINIITRPSFFKEFGQLINVLQMRAGAHVPAFGERPVPIHPQQFHLGPDPKTGKGLGLMDDLNIHQPDSNSFRDFQEVTNQACVYSECSLSCFRTKFNARCENHAGAMISEALVRPLVEGHQKFSPLFVALAMVAPKSCSFLYQGSRLLRHRIDPKVNEELHRVYGKPDEEDKSVKTAKPSIPDDVNADSDLEYLVNQVYGNETSVKPIGKELHYDELPLDYDEYEVDLMRDEYAWRSANSEERSVEDSAEGSAEGSAAEGSANDYVDESFEGGSGEPVFRWKIGDALGPLEFTPNVSGILHCQFVHDSL